MRVSALHLLGLSTVLLFCATLRGNAQLQNAGTLFVDLDGSTFTTGASTWTNSGSLGDFQTNGDPQAVTFGSGSAVAFDGAGDFFQQLNLAGSALENAPASLTGGGARSVEFMAFNPSILDEETVVSWGARGSTLQNWSVNYGDHPTFGALGGWGGDADMGWGGGGNPDANTPSANSWHHIVLTYDDGTGGGAAGDKNLYVDGGLIHQELAQPLFNTFSGTPISVGAQYANANAPNGNIEGGLQASLGIGRLRIHDGVLTPGNITNNFNELSPLFQDPPPPAPSQLTSGPSSRYSFNENGGAGTTLIDSIAGNDGTIVDVGVNNGIVGGGQLSLTGGAQADSDYADFPDFLVSTTAANGDPGDLSIEVWGTPQSTQNWSRVFSFGSATNNVLHMSWSRGTDQNLNELRFNQDGQGLGNTTTQDFGPNSLGLVSHWVVVFDDDGGAGGISKLSIYLNGDLVREVDTTLDIGTLGDLDVWLGRSQWPDNTANADYDEFRLYDRALSINEVLGNFGAGPDIVNVPEPAAVSLFGLGALALVLRRRRAKR